MNRLTRRAALVAGVATLCGAASVHAAAPADYPNRPIRVIVPLAPGGGSDYTARYLGPRLSERLGQTMVVDNRPAASGIVGTDLVAKGTPDGYTLLLVFSTHAQSAQLFTKLPYDPIKDFAPITLVISTPLGLILHPSIPAKTVREFIAHAKERPGKLLFGSSGPGSSPHLASELFASMAGISMTHVPYKGVAPQITAHIGGEIQLSFANMFTTLAHIKAGRLNLVASGGTRRSQAFPDLPTIAESGVPGYEALIWYGYMAPARTPRPIVDKLYREIAAVVNAPEVRNNFVSQGNDPVVNRPEEFAALIRAEADKWGALGKRVGVKLD
jgi:tripartite-type tricarboxylate transporter receptor subunit TctC